MILWTETLLRRTVEQVTFFIPLQSPSSHQLAFKAFSPEHRHLLFLSIQLTRQPQNLPSTVGQLGCFMYAPEYFGLKNKKEHTS